MRPFSAMSSKSSTAGSPPAPDAIQVDCQIAVGDETIGFLGSFGENQGSGWVFQIRDDGRVTVQHVADAFGHLVLEDLLRICAIRQLALLLVIKHPGIIRPHAVDGVCAIRLVIGNDEGGLALVNLSGLVAAKAKGCGNRADVKARNARAADCGKMGAISTLLTLLTIGVFGQ